MVFSVFIVIIHPAVLSINTSEDRVGGDKLRQRLYLAGQGGGKARVEARSSDSISSATKLHLGGGGDGRRCEKVKTTTCGGE